MNSHKNIKAVFLLLLSALPVLVVIVFMVSQRWMECLAEEALEQKSLTTITVKAGDIVWHEQGKEISINGHLFDVKDVVEIQPGILKVTGLYDWQEDQLYKELKDLMDDNNNEKSHKKQKGLIKWITSLYDVSVSKLYIPSIALGAKKYKNYYASFIKDGILEIESPPPQLHS